ncbi:unknown [Enterocloster bolteae CAG:59]|nr:unknown [Enterocloster bolteae CAG:59]
MVVVPGYPGPLVSQIMDDDRGLSRLPVSVLPHCPVCPAHGHQGPVSEIPVVGKIIITDRQRHDSAPQRPVYGILVTGKKAALMNPVKFQQLPQHILVSPCLQVHKQDSGIIVRLILFHADGFLHLPVNRWLHHHAGQMVSKLRPIQGTDTSVHNGIAVQIQGLSYAVRQHLGGKEAPHGAYIKSPGIHSIVEPLPQVSQLSHMKAAAEFPRNTGQPFKVSLTHSHGQDIYVHPGDVPVVV